MKHTRCTKEQYEKAFKNADINELMAKEVKRVVEEQKLRRKKASA